MHIFKYEGLNVCMAGDVVRLDKEESAHLFRTLRAELGEKCRLMDGSGRFALAEVQAGKQVKILHLENADSPLPPRLHMYIAPPRRQKMDQILRQAAELGVWRIVPMTTDAINGSVVPV